MDPGIICFQHCGSKVFCKSLPEVCPVCFNSIHDANKSPLTPFRVPYPFIKAAQYSCSVVIKPTTGDFLTKYYNSMDLHIGITNSDGSVVEYDDTGLHSAQNDKWQQCLLLDQVPLSWGEHWDAKIEEICSEKIWTASKYNEQTHNCYSFVLSFLNRVDYNNLSKAANNKSQFCEQFIVPRTTAAGKYISLFRKLQNAETFVQS